MTDYGQIGFTTAGASQDTGCGLDFDRNGLAKVSKLATAGKIAVLLIVNISCLGRNALKTMDFIRRFNERGIEGYSLLEGNIITVKHDGFVGRSIMTQTQLTNELSFLY